MKGLHYNLHSHTFRCGHAYGEDEEYVLRAIENGYTLMAFTDHVLLPGVSQPGIRGDYDEDFIDYVRSVRALQDRYKDHIQVLLGFECEWYHNAFSAYYEDLKKNRGFQIFGLGQHCILLNGNLHWYKTIPDPRESRTRYKEDVLAGMESRLFDYVCHPDLYVFSTFGIWDDQCEEIAKAIIEKAIELDMPLEINAAPSRGVSSDLLRSGTPLRYPYDAFWEIVSYYGAKAIIGIDAHSPSDYDTTDTEFLIDYAKKKGVRLMRHCRYDGKKVLFEE